MSRVSSIAAVLFLALAGCDRAGEVAAQREEGESVAAATSESTLTGEIDRMQAGTRLPDLTVADPAGETLDLGALEGQPVLLNLWATWCAPCVIEMPMLDELAGEFDGNLRVITVSQDIRGAEVVQPFFAKRDFARLEPWLDPDAELSSRFTPDGRLPLSVLFDAQGREVFRVAGGYDWDGEEAMAQVAQALADPDALAQEPRRAR
jgi:thiol-disulfide isomerase/thioredoxin